jgi:hypothetical protein
MDGSTSFPAYLLKGQRNVEFTITYWPQNIGGGTSGDHTQGILWDMINAIGTPAGGSLSPPVTGISHAFIIKDFDTGAVYTVTGAIANTVTISGKTNAALEVRVDYWCQNIMRVLPAYVTFPSDPGNVPFYFSQESVIFNQQSSPTVAPQTLTFTGTITNNLSRVPQFGTDVIRSMPTLTRKADGDMTATFATLSDVTYEGYVPNLQSTTTTGTTSTVLADTTQTFVASALIGGILTYITGPAAGLQQTITANGAHSITTAAFSPAPDASGDVYVVDFDTTLSGLAQQTIRIILGKEGLPSATSPTYTVAIDYTGAVLPKIDLTLPIADRVAVDLPWTATGAAVKTI